MQLARFSRYRLGHLPTPLEPMPRLTEVLRANGSTVPRLWIKRDDCTGLATGGNKTRKLEYLLADALAQGADTLVTQGATQSNHAGRPRPRRPAPGSAASCCWNAGMAAHLLVIAQPGDWSEF